MGVTLIIFVLVYLGSVIGGDQFGFVNSFLLKEGFSLHFDDKKLNFVLGITEYFNI